jgi:hypothetical protein
MENRNQRPNPGLAQRDFSRPAIDSPSLHALSSVQWLETWLEALSYPATLTSSMRFIARFQPHRSLIALLLATAVLLTGCARKVSPAKLQATPWVISDVSFEREKNTGFGSSKTPEAQGGFFRFFADGQLCASRNGELLIGRWTLDRAQSIVHLQYGEEKSESYQVSFATTDSLVFKTTVAKTSVIYTMEPDDFDYAARDIYSPAMNAWRLPARTEHTEAELQQRLLGMIAYLETYFEAASIRELERVDLSSLPTPFIFASNGVATYRSDRLPTKWLLLFARREEAENATRILGGLFHDVVMPQTSSRFERNAQIFSQLRIIYQRQIDAATQPAKAL